MSSLKGSKELKARLNAIKQSFKPVGREWGRRDVAENRARVPVRTGRLRKSFRVTSVSGKKTRVGGHYTAYFVDKGPKAHEIAPKHGKGLIFQGRHGTVFARKVHHRGYRGRPFRKRAADEALRQTPAAAIVIDQWNRAA